MYFSFSAFFKKSQNQNLIVMFLYISYAAICDSVHWMLFVCFSFVTGHMFCIDDLTLIIYKCS